uniref:Uncharacterized protein n=1 Tax=Tetraselmis chuii TaxID=63592 RepID=A0A7S1T021_9CHLO|mmetsp:Transcript_37555/g.67269  ORF Transcript_37555/g.67269 Transcript_37555/m.67269 type:complete len:114 (+) Transcript_37555:196-537(+)
MAIRHVSTGGKSSTISLQGLAAYEALIQMAMNHKSCAALPALAARLEMSTEDGGQVAQRSSPSGGGSNPLRSRGRQAPREEGIQQRERETGTGFASRMKKLLFANLALPGANA